MIVSFVFWNLRGNHASFEKRRPAILRCLTQLAASGINVRVFAECEYEMGGVVAALNGGMRDEFTKSRA